MANSILDDFREMLGIPIERGDKKYTVPGTLDRNVINPDPVIEGFWNSLRSPQAQGRHNIDPSMRVPMDRHLKVIRRRNI